MEAFRESDGFGQRSIQVEKVGPAEEVAPDVTEGVGRRSSEARRTEPGIAETDSMKDFHRSNQIRRLCIARRQERRRTRSEVEGKTAHQREKARHTPSAQNRGGNSRGSKTLAPSERQVINDALYKGMRAIEVVASVIAALIDIERKPSVVAGLKAHPFAERVSRGGRKTAREAAVKLHLQSMVARRVSCKQEIGRGRSSERVELRLSLLP